MLYRVKMTREPVQLYAVGMGRAGPYPSLSLYNMLIREALRDFSTQADIEVKT